MIKRSVTKFSMISSIQYTLAFITSFFEGMFSQSRTYYENNMISWYYQIRPKVVWKVHGAWIDGYDSPKKDENITITKIKSLYFFHAIYYKPCDSPPCYCCHLERHLKYITTLKNNNNMPLKYSPNTTANIRYSYLLWIWFQVEFCFNGGHLGHDLQYFNLVNKTCECFMLIVCIIRPLNIDEKSKLKCFVSRFYYVRS